MDGNNHAQHSLSVLDFVRRLLPHPPSAPAAGAEQPPSEASEVIQTSSPESAATLETISSGAPTESTTASTPAIVSSPPLQSLQNLSSSVSAAPMTVPAPDITAPQADSVRDVEMTSAEVAGPSSTSSSSQPASSSETRSTRRARVEDDGEEEDYWRESNRQRMHSPTPHEDNDHHHYMPIPEDHPVPESTRGGAADSQGNADAFTEQPQHPPQGPPPPYGSLFLTLDFIPIPFGNTPANARPSQPQDAPHPPNASQPANAPQPGPQRQGQDGHPMLNFLMNLPPIGPGPVPQPGAAGNDGGNAPGNAGFTPLSFTIPFTIPFPFGLDRLEERDDPERAQKLVDGLEEVPVGLIKRMQQVGGPGTDPGEVPTCAVCWESLLEPEGGGFEGNAELAKAEAAQAARDDAASQQGGESPMDVDGALSSSGESSSEIASGSSPAPESSGDEKQPKVVVLPCSHAFHATCLLPWFSKPGRTTCPSCRFDIDPDSLTYRPRPLRARGPPPDLQGGAAATQPAFGTHVPPVAVPQAAPVPPVAAQNAAAAPEGAPPADAEARPASAAGQAGPQPHQPLPPFMMFDVGMIIPMNPGRAAAGAAPPASGAQASNPTGPTVHGIPPPPPRTDNHGFRLADSVLQEVVRQTFERVFGGPMPPVAPQAPPAGDTASGENGPHAPRQPEWFVHPGPLPGFPTIPPLNFQGPQGVPRHQSGPRRPAEKRQWTPPPAPGPTLRQVVERKEREMGLRCSDISCGLGPSDDDPVSSIDLSSLRQISIRPLNADTSGKDSVCEHKFHPACLVSAERVAGWGREVKTGEPAGDSEQVEVSCPVCRAMGVISRLDWEEGACALA